MFRAGQVYCHKESKQTIFFRIKSVNNGVIMASNLVINQDSTNVIYIGMVFLELVDAVHMDRIKVKEYKKILSKVKKILC